MSFNARFNNKNESHSSENPNEIHYGKYDGYDEYDEYMKNYIWKKETSDLFTEIVRKTKYIENNIEKLPFSPILYPSLGKILEKDIDFLKMRFSPYYELKEVNINTIQQLISNSVFDLYNKGIRAYDMMAIIEALNKHGMKLLDYNNLENDIKDYLEKVNYPNSLHLCILNNNYVLIDKENTLLDKYFFKYYDYSNTVGFVTIDELGLSDDIVKFLYEKEIYTVSDFFNVKWEDALFGYYRIEDKSINNLSSSFCHVCLNDGQVMELKQRIERLEFEIALNLDFDNTIIYIIRSIEKNRYDLIYVKEMLKKIDINQIYRGEPLYTYIVEKLIGGTDKKQIANIVKYFIDIGADLKLFENDNYYNLLIMLSSTGKDNLNVEACKILLEHGVDPNVIMDCDGPFSFKHSTIYDHLYDAHNRWEREEKLWEGAGMGFCAGGSYVDDMLSPKEDIEEMQKLFSQYGYLPIYDLIDLLHDD